MHHEFPNNQVWLVQTSYLLLTDPSPTLLFSLAPARDQVWSDVEIYFWILLKETYNFAIFFCIPFNRRLLSCPENFFELLRVLLCWEHDVIQATAQICNPITTENGYLTSIPVYHVLPFNCCPWNVLFVKCIGLCRRFLLTDSFYRGILLFNQPPLVYCVQFLHWQENAANDRRGHLSASVENFFYSRMIDSRCALFPTFSYSFCDCIPS